MTATPSGPGANPAPAQVLRAVLALERALVGFLLSAGASYTEQVVQCAEALAEHANADGARPADRAIAAPLDDFWRALAAAQASQASPPGLAGQLVSVLDAHVLEVRAALVRWRAQLNAVAPGPRSLALADEFPATALAPALVPWGRHLGAELLTEVAALGSRAFAAAISQADSVVVAGRLSHTEPLFEAPADVLARHAAPWVDLVRRVAFSLGGLVITPGPRAPIVTFPQGVSLADDPRQAAFAFVRRVQPLADQALADWARDLPSRPRDAQEPRLRQMAWGLDLGPVHYLMARGTLICGGAGIVAARAAAQVPGAIVVNNVLRWQVDSAKRDPSSALYFDEFPALFQPLALSRPDGREFLAYRALTPASGGRSAPRGTGRAR